MIRVSVSARLPPFSANVEAWLRMVEYEQPGCCALSSAMRRCRLSCVSGAGVAAGGDMAGRCCACACWDWD